MRLAISMLLMLCTVACDGDVVDADGDSYSEEEDCNDLNANTWPGAPEACDGQDNDCDGAIDEHVTREFWLDKDGDGFGRGDVIESCLEPDGHATVDGDCDDTEPTVNPGQAEDLCDGLDNDCDREMDEDATFEERFADVDQDGFGDPGASVTTCDLSGTDYVADNTDCDDSSDLVYPRADELCDEIDNDCNSDIDDDPIDGDLWYRDADNDSHGSAGNVEIACTLPAGYVANDTDCDDSDDDTFPGAPELCDEADNDCDLEIDEAADIDGYCFKTWKGRENLYVYSEAGDTWCDSYFDSEGELTTFGGSCPDCEFAFEVTVTLDEDASEINNPICDELVILGISLSTDYSYDVAFTEDYDGYGEMLLVSYYFGWYPLFEADLNATTGEMSYDTPPIGDYTYTDGTYEYWYLEGSGTAQLSP
ncbi:MAG: putative metal-binding motif-containing protein [Myxococcota bacterium]